MELSVNGSVELRNGVMVPCIGFGTYKLPDDESAADSVAAAITRGYRHIDCAAFYKNERSTGAGIKKGMQEAGLSRGDIFITGKVWVSDRSYAGALASFDMSLKDLGLEYLDLLLIHWPADIHEHYDWREINLDTWKAFTELYRAGLVRAIGVSNFHPLHLEAMMEAEIPPMVNQIEFHPGYMQHETVEYCFRSGIAVEAWSPLGRGRVLDEPVIIGIAGDHGKTAAQICLRWALQHGVIPLPKSASYDRIGENLEIFDFSLSENEMRRIDMLPLTGWSGHTPENISFR